MLFNSIAFACFLLIVFIAYWCLPHKYRWMLILAANYYFYLSWNAKYIVLILFTTAVSYGAARLLEREESGRRKKRILAGAAVLCLGVLFFFKYFDFVSESVAALLRSFAIPMDPLTLKLLLPIGISFYTFQTLGYVIDVYRGDIPAERHFGYYAAFVSFFPLLGAGPIERARNLLPQIKARHEFDYDRAAYGLKLMAWGFFKKLVIADNLAGYARVVFDAPQGFSGFALVLASLFFTIQIYCDFSGYSDIAIGTAKLLGVDLMTNFKSPYFSQSVKEFWSRWHISLSTWFRDYVYIPLGGNRVGRLRHALNLMITFLLSGLWHGANWTFLAWGGVHGAAQVVENALLPKERLKSSGLTRWLRTIGIFAFCSLAWIFFAADSIGDAAYILAHLFTGLGSPVSYVSDGLAALDLGLLRLCRIGAFVFLLGVYDYFSLQTDCIGWISRRKPLLRHACYVLLLLLILFFRTSAETEFVYFQF